MFTYVIDVFLLRRVYVACDETDICVVHCVSKFHQNFMSINGFCFSQITYYAMYLIHLLLYLISDTFMLELNGVRLGYLYTSTSILQCYTNSVILIRAHVISLCDRILCLSSITRKSLISARQLLIFC